MQQPAIAPTLAASCITSGSRMRAIAVLERVGTGVATLVATLADKNAFVHVAGAATGGSHGHGIATHVNLAGDIDGGVLAGRELTPGVTDLAVVHLRLGVDAGPRTVGAIGKGDRHLLARGNRKGQAWLVIDHE